MNKNFLAVLALIVCSFSASAGTAFFRGQPAHRAAVRHGRSSSSDRHRQSRGAAIFDQGLTLIYAFNHEDAARSFRRAAELDPKSPMPWWGAGHGARSELQLRMSIPEREKARLRRHSEGAGLGAKRFQKMNALTARRSPTRYSNDPKADYHQAGGRLRRRHAKAG